MDKSRLLKIARKEEAADLVFKNGRIISVFDGRIEEGDLAIADGRIIGIGDYVGVEQIDLQGKFIAPGFIDGHVHIESSMLTPSEFAKIVMPRGTTSVVADPHEIANVAGVKGIRYMIESAKTVPLDVFIMVPSCVPATLFETSGAAITASDIASLKSEASVLGLGEVMNYPDVIHGDPSVLEKIASMEPKTIDGHAPSVSGIDLNAYALAGIHTDHECTTKEELEERIKRGMYVHLREGSATRNVTELLKGITGSNYHRLIFCTDDKHPEDIRKEGHINYNVNLVIEAGISPMVAIQMATINTAQCYGLKHYGAIAPGYVADLVVFEDLTDIEPVLVYKKGKLVAKNQKALFEAAPIKKDVLEKSVHINTDKVSFDLPLKSPDVRVIGLIENNVTTTELIETVLVVDGKYVHNPEKDLLKFAVIERHHASGNMGLALVKGYGLKGGAVAMTIAHDSHNLMILGDDDSDMRIAMDKIIEIGGGIVVVKEHQVADYLELEVGGIMTAKGAKFVEQKLNAMEATIRKMGVNHKIDDPFLSLAFLSLPVIPDLKCTDLGLFDVVRFKRVPIEKESGD